MKLTIHSNGLNLEPLMQNRIARRMGFALGRFGDKVGRVAVRLADINGPRGGVDKRCRVLVDVASGGPTVVEVTDSDLRSAIDRAADRIGRAVHRKLERVRLCADPAIGSPPNHRI
jgi:putative sigma-54 modulation protein